MTDALAPIPMAPTPVAPTALRSTLAGDAAKAAASPEVAKLRSVAKQFEAVFLRQMIGSMRQAKLDDGMFDSSSSEQFRDMGDAKLAEQMAGQGALHIADLLVKQFGAKLPKAPVAVAAAARDGAAK